MLGQRGFPKIYHVTYTKAGQRFKTKTWYADVWRDGIVKRLALGLDKAQAVKELKRQLSDRGLMQAGEVTVDDLLQWVEDDYRANARKSLPNLLPRVIRLRGYFLSNTKASQVTTDRIRGYQAQRQKDGAKNATINVELAILARGFSLAILYDRLTYKPKFLKLAENNARKGFFERPEFEAISAKLPLFLQPVAWTCYLTGWRPKKEVITREWKHVDFTQGWLRLEPHETKNGDGRDFPLGSELRAVLYGQRQRCDQLERSLSRVIPWVFCTDQGKRVTHYHDAWSKARSEAGLPNKLLYDCRRTRVRNFERAGVSRSAGMALTGHRTQSVYSRYAITDSKMLEDAVSSADRFEESKAHGRVKVKALKESKRG